MGTNLASIIAAVPGTVILINSKRDKVMLQNVISFFSLGSIAALDAPKRMFNYWDSRM
jgi:hypothetical protein